MRDSVSSIHIMERSAALASVGLRGHAYRLLRCRANSEPDDPLLHFCRLYCLCPGCNWMRIKDLLLTDLPKLPLIHASDEVYVSECEEMVWERQDQLGEFKGQVLRADLKPGTLTETRKKLKAEMGEILRNLRTLDSHIETEATRRILKEARSVIEAKGLPPAKEIVKILSRADQALADALSRRSNYQLQAITLTRRTYERHQIRNSAYRGLVSATKGDCFAKLYHQGALAAPGTGAVVALHLQSNVHLHALYWGPEVRKADLADSWSAIAKDGSFSVKVVPLLAEQDSKRWLRYMHRVPGDVDSDVLVRNWIATRGLRRLERYGVFRSFGSPIVRCGSTSGYDLQMEKVR